MNVSGTSAHAVDRAEGFVHPNVHLHTEVPLVAFLRLVHLRIAFLAFVLCGRRCGNDRCINDGSLTVEQAFAFKMGIDSVQDLPTQLVPFQQVAEVEDRGLVRYRASRVRQLNREIVNFGAAGPMGMRVSAPDF